MPKYKDTIICEDVRPEIGNKITFAGVFGDEIIVPQVPMAMQSFCIVQRWQATNEEIDRGVGEFSFALEWPNGNRQTMPPTAMPPPGKAVHGANLNFVLKFVGFPLQAKGEYKFITYINGEHANAVSFYVVLAAEAAALLQPKPKIGFKPS